MGFAWLNTRAQLGMTAPQVRVEVHVSFGLPVMNLVGLAETSVKESKDRVRSAIANSGFDFPTDRRVLVNLSPADLPKVGGRYDLPIALGILAATGQVDADACQAYTLAGELGLNGQLRGFSGVLPFAIAAARAGETLILPSRCADELALLVSHSQATIWLADDLSQLARFLLQGTPLAQPKVGTTVQHTPTSLPDLAQVRGQPQARRALEIAAAGGHNLLMSGPPGTGKTLLASCLPGILPPLSARQALQVAAIYSIAGRDFGFLQQLTRPFRNPHHTASGVALVGGGSNPRPGEISMAHQGVLFLDELTEYPSQVLNLLREPIESGEIRISRALMQVRYPARFQLVAAMNPCPCGYLGTSKACGVCTREQISRYLGKVSGPLLDRIDLHLQVGELSKAELLMPGDSQAGEASHQVRERVLHSRQRQISRQGRANALIDPQQLEACCQLDNTAQAYLERAFDKLRLSARAYHKTLRVARTIADMQGEIGVGRAHLLEAISYRQLQPHYRA